MGLDSSHVYNPASSLCTSSTSSTKNPAEWKSRTRGEADSREESCQGRRQCSSLIWHKHILILSQSNNGDLLCQCAPNWHSATWSLVSWDQHKGVESIQPLEIQPFCIVQIYQCNLKMLKVCVPVKISQHLSFGNKMMVHYLEVENFSQDTFQQHKQTHTLCWSIGIEQSN